MSGKNPHLTCEWPPKEPCLKEFRPGVRCCPISQEDRLECNLPQPDASAMDDKSPIIVDWPPKKQIGQGDEVDTGIREDLLSKIPNQIVPQVVTVHGAPGPGQAKTDSPMQVAKMNHPLCPDGQLHVEITPPQPVKTEIRLNPDLGCAVRQPTRRWRQCIENTLVNDRVRRPMARWCHKRRLPPLVIPTSEYNRLQEKCTETERKAREKEERIRDRECKRLESRRRMAKWNYTVESLLDQKKAKEEEKEKFERESFQKLLKDIKSGKDDHSAEQLARANRQRLYRKGLIQDLHSAMAFSKMMQDIERSRQRPESERDEDATLPICEQKCMRRMLADSKKFDDDQPEEQIRPKRINEKLQKILVNIEKRQKDQESEVNNQISCLKKMIEDDMRNMPKAKEPICREVTLQEKFLKRREEFYEEIDDKLAVDAYIESHEKEVERQACEYTKYLLHKEFIRKETEKRLIDEKVKYHMDKSERAAAVLVAMREKKKKESAHDYDALKEKWEDEIKDKEDEKKAQRDKLMQKVTKDFLQRKGVEKTKESMRDASRLWAQERMVAAENYEQECDRKNQRRQEAEEIALYNQALASEKKCQMEREKHVDRVWAEKMKNQYFEEMQNMKDYANECIRDWAGKGRSTLPMHHAMKKWEYDSQMDPRMFREYERKLAEKKKERGGGDGDNNFAEIIVTQASRNPCLKSTVQIETTQSTSQRLGFC